MVVANGRYILTSMVSGDIKNSRVDIFKKTQNVKLLPCAVFEPEVKQQWKITHHFPRDNWLNKGKSTDHKTSRPPPSQWLFVPLGSLGSRGCFYPMLRRASKLWYMSDKESLRCPADVLDWQQAFHPHPYNSSHFSRGEVRMCWQKLCWCFRLPG